MRKGFLAGTIAFAALTASAQWQMQDSHTTASFRGIHSLAGGVAWASGTDGTVLRTLDGGRLWQRCATPPGAEKLDFRGVQGLDKETAYVMSAGEGDLSRLYQTTDGCKTWKLMFSNPDAKGFWDALYYSKDLHELFILGDPVDGNFRLFFSIGDGKFSDDWNGHPIAASEGQAAFAASNSLFAEGVGDGRFSFITGGAKSEIVHEEHGWEEKKGTFSEWSRNPLPFASGAASGAFSMAASGERIPSKNRIVVVVGGDYQHPDSPAGTAAFSTNLGYRFEAATKPPHGYRSSVAYDTGTRTWIAVGPNGTDISIDDGRNWRALKPGAGDAPDTDSNWNALSLPFVVGPKGRIGVLRPKALEAVR